MLIGLRKQLLLHKSNVYTNIFLEDPSKVLDVNLHKKIMIWSGYENIRIYTDFMMFLGHLLSKEYQRQIIVF